MAFTKPKIREFLEERDLYDGDYTDSIITEILFNKKVISDAKNIMAGKSDNDIGNIYDEEGERVLTMKEPSGYFLLTNKGQTLQVNPVFTKLYQDALKNYINLCREIGLSKKARLEMERLMDNGETQSSAI